MINTYKFLGKNIGPKFLVLGAIHGNEICGPIAINKLIGELNKNPALINSGEVTFVPICNPRAYTTEQRQIDINLNRIIMKHSNPLKYEDFLANELVDLISDSNFILDLHSIPSAGDPFVFQDYQDYETESFAKAIGIKNILVGWPELSRDAFCMDTITFAHSIGKIGLTVECGNHNQKSSWDIAYQSIINSLKHFGLIDGKDHFLDLYDIQKVSKVFIKTKNGNFINDWTHFQKLNKGQIIAIFEDGEKIIMQDDGFIILPDKNAIIGSEWFYY